MPPASIPRIKRADLTPGECLCSYCTAKCCRYFALAMETPTTPGDFDFIRWYLMHEHAAVFTEDGIWYLLVYTDCKHLQPDNRCGIYDTRPQICREYSTENCEFDNDWVYDQYFETSEQLEEYIEARFPPEDGKSIRSQPPPLLPLLG